MSAHSKWIEPGLLGGLLSGLIPTTYVLQLLSSVGLSRRPLELSNAVTASPFDVVNGLVVKELITVTSQGSFDAKSSCHLSFPIQQQADRRKED